MTLEEAVWRPADRLPVAELRRAANDDARARWLLGVCLGAQGRYGSALEVLQSMHDGLALATVASIYRQLGKHVVARTWDERALEHDDDAARFDGTLGLGADAVGINDTDTARRRLAEAREIARGRRGWWRQRTRLAWLAAEIGLLTDDRPSAVRAARVAVAIAEQESAHRHIAKSLLFAGVAANDASDLRRCLDIARRLRCRPLIWPALVVLARLEPVKADTHRRRATAVVCAIADDLPAELRAEWLMRPEFAELPEMFLA